MLTIISFSLEKSSFSHFLRNILRHRNEINSDLCDQKEKKNFVINPCHIYKPVIITPFSKKTKSYHSFLKSVLTYGNEKF